MNTNPSKPTEVYLILHEAARVPDKYDSFEQLENRQYHYMVGNLREKLQDARNCLTLTDGGYRRVTDLAKKLKGKCINEIVTEDFATPYETARVIASLIDNPTIVTDDRVAESDLSYLSKQRFSELHLLSRNDPFVFTRDWYTQATDQEKGKLFDGHEQLWDETLERNDGIPHAYVLHVEGIQFLVSLLLGIPKDEMVNLHFRRGSYVHVHLEPNKKPTMSF